MYKVSFLIPVYNAGDYISNCLEHILQSELSNDDYQIIAWDDGSKDNSLNILWSYASKYPNIIVKHAENRGVAAVRKDLFALADGQYIWQCDADDYIETKKIKQIVDFAVCNNVDYCSFDYYSYDDKGNKREQSIRFKNQIFTGFLWNRLYKTQFLRENNITFKGDLYTGDDYIFNCLVFSCAKEKCHLPICGYNYNYNPNSLTRDKSKVVKDISSMLHCCDYLIEEYYKCTTRQLRKYWYRQIFIDFAVVIWMSYSLEYKFFDTIYNDVQHKVRNFYKKSNLRTFVLFHPFQLAKCFTLYCKICSKFNRLYIKLR